MYRTIEIQNTCGHVLLPFLINSGDDVLLGATAFNTMLEAGARLGYSSDGDEVLLGVDWNIPVESGKD